MAEVIMGVLLSAKTLKMAIWLFSIAFWTFLIAVGNFLIAIYFFLLAIRAFLIVSETLAVATYPFAVATGTLAVATYPFAVVTGTLAVVTYLFAVVTGTLAVVTAKVVFRAWFIWGNLFYCHVGFSSGNSFLYYLHKTKTYFQILASVSFILDLKKKRELSSNDLV